MTREEAQRKIDFIKDLLFHWEEDYYIGMITRQEFNKAYREGMKEIKELKKFI